MRCDGWTGLGDGLLLLGQLVLMAKRPKVAQRFVENTSTASVMNGRGSLCVVSSRSRLRIARRIIHKDL